MICAIDEINEADMELEMSRCELDSHANLPVVGGNAFVLADTGRTASVSPYSPDYKAKQIPIVDAALLYHDKYLSQDHILIIRNALYVPSMNNHLLPPFILREHGIKVNDTPKIHVSDPSVDDHAIIVDKFLRIPLALHGTFSYFDTKKPSKEELDETESVLLLTPQRFDAHDTRFAQQEEYMLDWEGEIRQPENRDKLVLAEMDFPEVVVASLTSLPQSEQDYIDSSCLLTADDHQLRFDLPPGDIEIASMSTTLCDRILYDRLSVQEEISNMKMSIGSCETYKGRTLIGDVAEPPINTDDPMQDDVEVKDMNMEEFMNEMIEDEASGQIDFDEVMASATYAKPSKGVTASHLSKIWKIDLKTAQQTVDATSQLRKHSEDPSMSRNYGTNDRMLRYKRINQFFYMDTFFATKKGGKSSRGNTCCQIFVTDKGFVYVVPMRSKKDVLLAVKQFAKEIGAPDAVVCDAAGEQTSLDLKRFLNSIGTTLRVLEEGTPWSNRAELYIGLMKAAVRKDMRSSNCPFVFWDYCMQRRARINNLTPKDSFALSGQVPATTVSGEQGDISNMCVFGWYEWCYFLQHKAAFPHNKEVLGRVLGPATGVGNEMCQWVLQSNGSVVARRTVRPLKPEEIHSSDEQQKRLLFDSLIRQRKPFKDTLQDIIDSELGKDSRISSEEEDEWEDLYNDDNDNEEDNFVRPMPDIEDQTNPYGQLINQQPVYDLLLNLDVQMEAGKRGKVIKRVTAPDGSQVGVYDNNPALNTIMYEVEFDDGMVQEFGATSIAENILDKVDEDGFSSPMFQAIVDWKKDSKIAIPKSQAYVQSAAGKRLRKTTKGWKLKVKWNDGTASWIDLKYMKESNPVDVAEFAVAHNIENEPAFKWWVPYTLRKKHQIISAIKTRVRKVTHKYGVQLPTSVEDAKRLDSENGNNLWMKALAKEINEIGVAIDIQDNGVRAPPGWSKITGHLIWDVKMDLTRKARWVLDGHKMPDPLYSQFAGVVTRESVRIAFLYAALNQLDVCAADIRNAYLQAPSSRKDYIICGPEFGLENIGKVALVRRAIYGGKTSGRDFRNHLRSCMHHLNFQSCPADPDVWMRPAIKSDGNEYWEYILLYTDDALCISEYPERTLRNELGRYFKLKEESIGPPKIYLGGNVRKVMLEHGVEAWAFGSSQYVQQAVANVEKYLEDRRRLGDDRFKIPARANTPMRTSYRPELDTSPELIGQDASYYMSLIGVLRWIVELGRADICLECSMMSSCLALPRIGHLEQVMHIFGYLKQHHNAELVFDPTYPEIDENAFQKKDWSTSEFGHLEGKEILPPNQPQPRGQGVVVRANVDADHATDTTTRMSRTGFLVYVNSALIYWFSKKQTSVESSSFGSEFCAMKLCCEYIRGLRYKLRMMGIPVLGPAFIYGDNQSVLNNTSIPDSQLKKKCQSIAYHFIREGVARDEWRTAYINTHENEADLLTKQLPSGDKRRKFVRRLLHYIFRSG